MFNQKIPLHFENSNYLVKTVTDKQELLKVFKLRYDIFYKEFNHKKNFLKLDKDKFDDICDHLIIIEKSSGLIIGTYRLNCSLFTDKFYSSTEFDISNVLKLSGIKIELGRACLLESYRKNSVLILLWRGIAEYSKIVGAKYLFGLSSVKQIEESTALSLYDYLDKNYHSEIRVFPKKAFKAKEDVKSEFSLNLIPNLLKFYLRCGSLICGEPAYDKKLNCYDFFTILDLHSTTKDIKEKFFNEI